MFSAFFFSAMNQSYLYSHYMFQMQKCSEASSVIHFLFFLTANKIQFLNQTWKIKIL